MIQKLLAMFCLLALAATATAAQERIAMKMVKPPALKAGDTIALVAPAGVGDPKKVDAIEAGLAKLGLKIKRSANLTERYGYLGGTDEARAAGVMDAWRDPGVQGVFCITGGFGTTRMLDKLDYRFIRENPKVFTGFSDITGLHLAIQRQAGLVTFHSPTSEYALSANAEERPLQARYLWGMVMPGNAGGEPLALPDPVVYTDEGLTTKTLTIRGGKARGQLTGGNLSLIQALMGTPWEIETKDRILFIEDVGEAPYRVDRMLSNLRLAGKLDSPAGVIFGQFSKCDPENPERSFTVDDLIAEYFAKRHYPVVSRFPSGHVIDNATLPLGVMAELDADARTLTLLESPLAP